MLRRQREPREEEKERDEGRKVGREEQDKGHLQAHILGEDPWRSRWRVTPDTV